MLFCELEVCSATDLIYVGGAGIDAAERSKFRGEHLVADNAALLGTLKRTKEKSPVLTDWASERQPKLPALEERIGIERVAIQRRVSGEMVVTKEVEA